MTNSKLYYFNPGHEAAILNESPYYMVPANVLSMQRDLAYLPAWMGTPDDYIFMENILPGDFIDDLRTKLHRLPQGITPTRLQSLEKKLSLHLWGISPQAIHFFNGINYKYNLDIKLPEWHNSLKELSSRKTASDCLKELSLNLKQISDSIIPSIYTDLGDIECLVKNNDTAYLAKSPFSSSGRGLLWLPKNQLTQTERQILHGILKKQNYVCIEKVLSKKLDFAMEFNIFSDNTILFEGYSLFRTNEKGAYSGNLLLPQKEIEKQISEYIAPGLLNDVKESLRLILKSKFKDIYSGCIGVDMMIYEEGGQYRLHPCVEINVRDNMGLLSIKITQNFIHENSEGVFLIEYNALPGEAENKHEYMKNLYPLKSANSKILSGYISLCPVLKESKYRAYMLINKSDTGS